MYEWLKLGHVVGAMIWVGAGITFSVLVWRIGRSNLATKRAMLTSIQKVNFLFPLAAALVIGLGVWMVIDSPAIGFGDTWLVVAYTGIVLSGVVQGFVDPQLKRLDTQLEAGDPAAHDTWRRIARTSPIDSLLLLIVVWAMVIKPG